MKVAVPVVLASCFSWHRLTSYFTGGIAKDERVVFFPTIAYRASSNSTSWQVPIHGWIFEPEEDSKKRKAFLRVLHQALNIQPDSDENSDKLRMLDRRVRSFLVDNERYKAPRVTVLDKTHKMNRSGKNGHFKTLLQLPDHEVTGKSIIQIKSIAKDGRSFQGNVHLVTDSGLSIISDIDDTIKITNVTNKKNMLSNTFLKEFHSVPGMPETYRHWQEAHNATFHFVSSSPWQLYEELETFRGQSGFPRATFHLKSIRPKDKSILNLFKDPVKTKSMELNEILSKFPNRRFVLVGDSGEKDPEVYGEMARLYPSQILAIFIRNVSDETVDGDRMSNAFQGINKEKWKLFTDASTLVDSLDETMRASCR